MKADAKTSQPSFTRLSPVFEKTNLSDGSGMIGFTVHISEDRIKNHVEHYDASSRDTARARIERLHARYLRETGGGKARSGS